MYLKNVLSFFELVNAGQGAIIEHAHIGIKCLTELVAYPHKMVLSLSSYE